MWYHLLLPAGFVGGDKTKWFVTMLCMVQESGKQHTMLLSTSSLRVMSVIFTMGRDSSDKHIYLLSSFRSLWQCSAVHILYEQDPLEEVNLSLDLVRLYLSYFSRSELRGHILSLPTLLPFTQVSLKFLSLKNTPVLFLTISYCTALCEKRQNYFSTFKASLW